MLRRLNHPHLISLLATYQHIGHFHLIFPWAECDLRTYWEIKVPNPLHDMETLLWTAMQCEGIAEGLDSVHHHPTSSMSSILQGFSSRSFTRFPALMTPMTPSPLSPGASRRPGITKPRNSRLVFGRHGDIKPTNLLWFPDHIDANSKGTIKICDFGAGEFSTDASSKLSSNSIAHTPSYRPPESDFPDYTVTDSWDIWTLGCLYLEFITWFMGGSKLLDEFKVNRGKSSSGPCRTNAFFEIVRDPESNEIIQPQKARVKETVSEVSSICS
jgi:serine/threonine protein kinase